MSQDSLETEDTFAFVVYGANKFAGQSHDLMTVILEPDCFDLWMRGAPDIADSLMFPAAEKVQSERVVCRAVEHVMNNCPELLAYRPTGSEI